MRKRHLWGRPHWEESQAVPRGAPVPRPPDPDRQQLARPRGPKDSTPSSNPDIAPSVEDPPEETLELTLKN